jgi:hypothetical protein
MADQTEPKIHILVLAANPKGTSQQDLAKEARKIKEILNACHHRERFSLETYWAVNAEDLQFALATEKPQIVQFIGHGAGELGLIFESDIERHQIKGDKYSIDNRQFVQANALTNLFSLFSRYVECVILNACYSEVQAAAICQSINYVIGIQNTIGDREATKFSAGFYTSLGNDPRGIEIAYMMGRNALELIGLDPSPFILKKKANPLTLSYASLLEPSVDCHPAIALGPVRDWCTSSSN